MLKTSTKICQRPLLPVLLLLSAAPVSAYTLVDKEEATLSLDTEIVLGHFRSDQSYGNADSRPAWTEAYAKSGLSGSKSLGQGTLFGTANLLYSTTLGDGDAAGLTTGDENDLDLEELFLGYRTEWFSVSAGRQNIRLGDGFLINGDALNLGEGLDGIVPGYSADRGGAYWLAARKAFDQSVLLSAGAEDGLRGDLFWFKSDNPAQSSVEMAGLNAEHVNDFGTFGLLLLEGLAVDADQADFLGQQGRDGQSTWSLRYEGSAGQENLFLAAQYVNQTPGNDSPATNAWYAEAGWTFAAKPWSPSVNIRISEFDTGYDPLFFGFSRGYGTWFQGEVAANYAGPFGTDATIAHLGIKASPRETLTIGASYFGFSDTADGSGANDATEIDLWAEWVAHDHLIISPVLGFYTPDSDTSTQGNDKTNTYAQVIAVIPF